MVPQSLGGSRGRGHCLTPRSKAARRGAKSKAKTLKPSFQAPQEELQEKEIAKFSVQVGHGDVHDVLDQTAKQLQLDLEHLTQAAKLLQEGATLPFIAAYRKEVTGNMSMEQLHHLDRRLRMHSALQEACSQLRSRLSQSGEITLDLENHLQQCQDLDDVKALEEYLTSQQRLQQGNVWMFPVAEATDTAEFLASMMDEQQSSDAMSEVEGSPPPLDTPQKTKRPRETSQDPSVKPA